MLSNRWLIWTIVIILVIAVGLVSYMNYTAVVGSENNQDSWIIHSKHRHHYKGNMNPTIHSIPSADGTIDPSAPDVQYPATSSTQLQTIPDIQSLHGYQQQNNTAK